MKIKKIENLLGEMSERPEFKVSRERLDGVFSMIDTAVSTRGDSSDFEGVSRFGFSDIKALPSLITDLFARPVAFIAMVFVMALGGWIGGVNASLETLPGDILYPVKLVSEKAQLTLALPGARAQLHSEFASRRVNEVAELVRSDESGDKAVLVQQALDGFSMHMDGVEASLDMASDDEEVAVLARVIEEKTIELEAVLEMSDDINDEESSTAIVAVVAESNDAKSNAVSVLVESGEDSVVSMNELARQFKNELKSLMFRKDMLLGRFDRVGAVISERGSELSVVDARIAVAGVDFSDAMDFASIGGYERAFAMLGEKNAVLVGATSELVDVEIALTRDVEVVDDVGSNGDVEDGEVVDDGVVVGDVGVVEGEVDSDGDVSDEGLGGEVVGGEGDVVGGDDLGVEDGSAVGS